MSATILSQDRVSRDAAADGDLRAYLQDYLKSGSSDFDKTTRYSAAFAELIGAKVPEVVVYVSGSAWCGSGGCSTLILRKESDSFKVITPTTVTRSPISVLQSTTNGWHVVSVWVQGGGIQPGYTALLPFDGKAYASNPTVPPARHSTGDRGGAILIPQTAEGFLL